MECPFGITARDCEYQETLAKDVPSALEGDLIFTCKLKSQSMRDCPRKDCKHYREHSDNNPLLRYIALEPCTEPHHCEVANKEVWCEPVERGGVIQKAEQVLQPA